ncbi:helix-hairpin-helix domain-containing protein [Sphingobacterium lactis]|uniref:helix-hairpin-helix domain-containing protein n=1 Tax=Sphingobacterium lactis TaxID=797291 RepID=UPI003F80832E
MKHLFELFRLNQREQRGVMVLLFLIFVFLVIHLILPLQQNRHPIKYELIVHKGQKGSEEKVLNYSDVERKKYSVQKKDIAYFSFDPNSLDESGWEALDLTKKQIKGILNYRSKGGRFRDKADLAKLYSLRPQDVERLTPFVQIKEDPINQPMPEERPYSNKRKESFRKILINVNAADTNSWMEVRGIGPVFSKRIVKFRDALGGFHDINQLKEVYGIPEDIWDKIHQQIQLMPNSHKRILINQISIDSLAKHPYVRYKRARTIINYRVQHGNFKELADLKKILSLDEEFFIKIEPYLDFDHGKHRKAVDISD